MSIYFFILYLILILIFFEIILRTLNSIFKYKFLKKNNSHNYYPILPKKYYKIAIFGGSAAAGYNANLNFASIIQQELINKTPNNLPPYVMNFSFSSQPFYNGQAKVAKKLISYFDLIIIYSGNNENSWLVQDFMGSSKENFHNLVRKINSVILSRFSVIRALYNNVKFSILLLLFFHKIVIKSKTLLMKYMNDKKIVKQAVESHDIRIIKSLSLVSKNPIFFPNDKEVFVNRFIEEVEELVSIGEKLNKKIIFIGVSNNDLFSPAQSLIIENKYKKNTEVINIIQNTMKELGEKIESSEYNRLEELNSLINYYPNCAILYHLIAKIHLRKFNYNQAIKYFEQCFNHDLPLIGRSCEDLNYKIKTILNKYPTSVFLDTRKYFTEFLFNIKYYDSLFSDVQHPSDLGHILISEIILKYFEKNHATLKIKKSKNDYENLLLKQKHYYDIFGIFNKHISQNYFLSFRWMFSCIMYTSSKKEYLEKAKEYIELWWSSSFKTECKSTYYFWCGLLAAYDLNEENVKINFNKSKKVNLNNFKNLLSSVGTQNIPWSEHIKFLGFQNYLN